MSKRIYLSPPWISVEERNAVGRAFDSGYVAPCGPMVDEFERRLSALSGCHAAAVSSGTAALDLLMAELGCGRGARVIVSSLTFVSSAGPAWHRGAKLEFVDSDPATGTMDVRLLERALDEGHARRTIVVAVDIYGQCCDYDALEDACARHGATLVIDAAESVGASCRDRASGSAGAAAIYSFNGNKIITTSGGGAVLSRDKAIVDRSRWRAQQAREPVEWYEHREVGYNYRMSNLLAGLGCAQVARLKEIIRRKRCTFEAYRDALAGMAEPFPCADYTEATRWLSVFIFPTETRRNEAAARLRAIDAECRPVWKPMHLQPVFAKCRAWGGKVSEDLFRRGLCLPSGAGLGTRDRERIIAALVQ